jgi:alanine-glyoxylate transaminase/serine-glyoxylate transaminase/serine-pyruvate transaminase
MTPGPIEFEPAVLQALGAPTNSHVGPEFLETFGQVLAKLRQVFFCPDGQPLALSGTGTLAMDCVAANLTEPGDRVLVVNTGYFSDRFAAMLERYGAAVTQARAPVGSRPSLEEVEAALARTAYKFMTVTHVDTSTGVLTDVRALAALARRYGTLIVVDGVCSIAGEALDMQDWGVDVALTASQKAIGVPPGLALMMIGPRAMEMFADRKSLVTNYYADWSNWFRVMAAYENRTPGYFGTPAVNLINALNVSLDMILAEGLEARLRRHQAISRACKAGLAALGLEQVPAAPEYAAHLMSAPYYPAGVNGGEFLQKTAEAGVVLAGGLHPEIKARYFRIGHMGSIRLGSVLTTLGAVEQALTECGYSLEPGAGVAAAQQAYLHREPAAA